MSKNPGDEEEHAELKEKIAQVAARQSIVERLVPAVEANLSVGGGNDDNDDGDHQHHERLARRAKRRSCGSSFRLVARRPKWAASPSDAGPETFCRAICHRAEHSGERIAAGYQLAKTRAAASKRRADDFRGGSRERHGILHRNSCTRCRSTITLRSGAANGGRRRILAATPPPISNRNVRESALRNE